MTEVSAYVPGPYEGVSQAPPQVRLPGSCDVMEDCWATLPNGIQKRPPWVLGQTITSSDGAATARMDVIPQAVSVGYDLALIINYNGTNNLPTLWRTDTWAEVGLTVSSPAQAYLNANTVNPKRDLRTLSVEDFTFILNRTVPIAKGSDTNATRPFEAILWCKSADYGERFTITVTPVGGTPVTITVNCGLPTDTNAAVAIQTTAVMAAAYDGTLVSAGNSITGTPLNTLTSQGMTVTLDGSTIYLSHPTVDFTVDIADGQGATALVGIKESVENFSDLPLIGFQDFVIEVLNQQVGGNSNYWVQYQANLGSSSGGVWQECLAPGALLGQTIADLPVAIQGTIGTGFTLDVCPWLRRTTGDETTSPDPDYVGENLTAIKWWKGRLALISPGSCTFSASDNPFKFYTTTLATALDSDPIGLLPPDADKGYFGDAIQFDQRFVTLGDLSQGIVNCTSAVLAPSSTGIYPLSTTDYADQMPAFGVNHKVYFGSKHSGWMAIHEIAIDRFTGLAIPQVVTAAVPAYLPDTIDMACPEPLQYLGFYASSGDGRIYVNVFREDQNNLPVQDTWFTWNCPTGYTVASMFIKESVLYLLGVTSGGALVTFTADLVPDPGYNVSNPILGQPLPLQYYMDFKITQARTTVSYNSGLNRTTFILPYAVTLAGVQVSAALNAAFGSYPIGHQPQVVSATGSTIVLAGDWHTAQMVFGFTYNSYFIPSQFFYFGQDNKPVLAKRLTIRRLRVDVASFGVISCEVMISGRAAITYTYQGLELDDADTPIDAPMLMPTVQFTVPVNGNAKETKLTFSNNTIYGFKLLGYEWEANLFMKARRLT